MGKRGFGCRRFSRELHHCRILHLDQTIRDHLVQGRQDLIDLLRSLDELDPDRQVLGQNLDLGRVQ